jgi:predicted dehydrogenase
MLHNIALIGCGAIARAFYLPALAKHKSRFNRIWLVDPSDHALSMAEAKLPFIPRHKIVEVDDEIDLAIVAAPNPFHFELAEEVLLRGANVLLEKPFVIWPRDGRALIELAIARNRIIVVNQTRRLYPIAKEIRQRIHSQEFGPLKSIVHREGTKLNWPFESGAAFTRNAQRTGVIMDFGVHVMDFYHYLLQPAWALVSAIHDGFEGPEGLAQIELLANDVPISLRLSRYHVQENVARLMFEKAEISFNVYDGGTYSTQWKSGKLESFQFGRGATEYGNLAETLLLNFLAASEQRESALCTAASAMPVITLLDDIYRHARRYPADLGSV